MTLNLPPEYEHLLSDAVARGHFATPIDALKYAIGLLAAEQGAPPAPPPQEAAQWALSFRQWAESHEPSDHYVDVSRESIYDGRGM